MKISSSLAKFLGKFTAGLGSKSKYSLAILFIWLLYKFGKRVFCSGKQLRGEIIFITGANSGIGRLMAFRLARLGAAVVIANRNLESGQRVANAILAEKKEALAVQCDVTDINSVKEAAEIVRNHFGNPTILINNAGVVFGKSIIDSNIEEIHQTMQVNAISHFYTIKEFLPDMLKANHGHIVTVSSAAGLFGVPGAVDYSSSKFASVGINESLRVELKMRNSKVKTTCICPYFINTGMFNGITLNFTWLFPMLDEQNVASRIIRAIRMDEEIVVLPWHLGLVALVQKIVPVAFLDKVLMLMGYGEIMRTFKGKHIK